MKGLLLLCLSVVVAFAINLQTASKADLMEYKGIGEKKADAIVKYRKTHKLKKAEDLRGIKGFGDSIVNNVKKGVKKGSKSSRKMKQKGKNLKHSKKSSTKTNKKHLKKKNSKRKKKQNKKHR